jgi:hypothetical protein
LVQVEQWFYLDVEGQSGRYVRILDDTTHVQFNGPGERARLSAATMEELARAIKRYCEDGASLGDLGLDA